MAWLYGDHPHQTPMIETEIKFLIRDLPGLARRLEAAGARPVHPEVRETNLRFDRPDGALRQSLQVLRLRQDSRVRLTFKGPPSQGGEVGAREEIEFEVSDFDAARAFLEALGYRIVFVYEKFRTTYQLGEVEITLDRTPLGDFVELEGPGAAEIAAAAQELGLNWPARSLLSYSALFERVKAGLGLDFRDLSFANFEGLGGIRGVLGLDYGDG